MSQEAPQTYANHTRFDPLFHFLLVPIFALGVVLALVHFFYHFRESDFRDNFHSFLLIVLAFAMVTLVFKVRLYALKVQDRIIRLEERLRLAQNLAEPLRLESPIDGRTVGCVAFCLRCRGPQAGGAGTERKIEAQRD